MNRIENASAHSANPAARPGVVGFVAALLLVGVGCTADAGSGDTEAPSATLAELVTEGELSPMCGESFEGSLDAEVPVRGLSATPDDEITAYVFDNLARDWVEVGRTRSNPIAMAQVDGEAVYPFDFGSACIQGCELQLTPQVWGGFGPFAARFKLYSQAHGWLPAPSPAWADPDHVGCRPGDAAEILVRANPLSR